MSNQDHNQTPVSVLFVCMGNICRSPTAEGVFRHHVRDAGLQDRILADSAGTHAYHVGEPPDHRARAAAERRGYSLDDIRARRVSDLDFEGFDFIIAMDADNLAQLHDASDVVYHGKIGLFLDFVEQSDYREVPDPYYGGAKGFERVLDLVEEASRGLLDVVKARL
jgi:protein-tyrosine phosphatase